MPNFQNATKCYKIQWNLVALFIKVTEYRSRNNGMLRNDLQTDLGT